MRSSLLKRSAFMSLAAILAASVVAFAASGWYVGNTVIEEGAKDTSFAADSVFLLFKNLDPQAVLEDGANEEWIEKRAELFRLCRANNLAYLTVYTADPEAQTRTYLYAAASDIENDVMMFEERSVGAVVAGEIDPLELDALAGRYPSKYDVLDNRFGRTYVWTYPLIDAQGRVVALIGAEYSAEEFEASMRKNMLVFALPMIGVMLLTVLVSLLALRKGVVLPLQLVSGRMRTFIEDSARKYEPLEIASGDEIQEIADSFNQMSSDIELYVDRIEAMTSERVAEKTELDVARRIQVGMVPPHSHLVGAGFEISAFARSARAVGGDFYGCFVRDDGAVCAFIGDVSGKGVSAALFMAVSMTLIGDRLRQNDSPAAALNVANDALLEENPEGMFATVFALVFDPSTGELVYANAGHTPPVLVGEEARFLEPDPGIALGLFEDAGLVDGRLQLPPGEGLVLYTDGATDALNPDGVFFGEQRLLENLSGLVGSEALVRGLAGAVEAFSAGRAAFDDLTLLALAPAELPKKVAQQDRPENDVVWRAHLAPETASFAELREALLAELGVDAEAKRVVLACDEAFANIVAYAGASEVTGTVERAGGGLVVELADDGVPFNPLDVEAAERDFEDLEFGGMGIAFYREIARDVTYRHADGKNILRLSFAV